MRFNADFSKAATVIAKTDGWVASPQAGVRRLMLDRIGNEDARATTIVEFAPDSFFPAHDHPEGEEFLVLEGIFSDEHGDFPAGTYARNPDGSSHTPFSKDGCVLFVKLRQFADGDSDFVKIDTATGEGARRILHQFGSETVEVLQVDAGETLADFTVDGGVEYLVIEGEAVINDTPLPRWSWMRLPDGATASVTSAKGCRLYRKTGHLT